MPTLYLELKEKHQATALQLLEMFEAGELDSDLWMLEQPALLNFYEMLRRKATSN